MVKRRKLYQSWSLLRRLNRVLIWGQCCRYVWVIFSSAAGIRFEGIRTGSSSQLKPAVAADAWVGAGRVPGWADFLGFFAAGASFEVVALPLWLSACCCWWTVRTWALKDARLWKFSPQVAQVNVRSAACLLWAFKCLFRFDFVWKLLSQRAHWWGFSPVWTRLWLSSWLGRVKVLPQVSQQCSLRCFLAVGSPSPNWISYN